MDAVERVIEIAQRLRVARGELEDGERDLRTLAERLRGEVGWAFPVGTEEFPPEAWYVSVWHDLSGRRNGGYRHTGIDINLDRYPWGDVERGAPVYAVAQGTVVDVGSSAGWLGVVVLRVEHRERWLYVRYGHLDGERLEVLAGQVVEAGQVLGYLGDYRRGDTGDHLHFDVATESFGWGWWLTRTVDWVDPVPVLEAHLGEERVKRMLGREDG